MRTTGSAWSGFTVAGALALALLLCMGAERAQAGGGSEAALRARLEATGSGEGSERLREFYRARSYRSIWWEDGEPRAAGALLLAALGRAGDHGLAPGDYRTAPPSGPDKLAARDLALTQAFLRYCRDLSSGRPALRNADPEWFLEADRVDHLAALAHALDAGTLGELLASLPPATPGYRRLQEALTRYRGIAAAGGWGDLPEGETLRLGSQGEAVAALEAQLRATGDLTGDLAGSGGVFGETLRRAVRGFQLRHGLDPDGAVGPATRAALNVPAAERVRQLELNLERLRWMPRDLGRRYVLVNMAAFDLQAVEGGTQVFDSRVIVGRAARRTPAFGSPLRYLEFHPYWNVTPRVAALDIVPRAARDPGYLAREGFRVFRDRSPGAAELDPSTIDWQALQGGPFPYLIRQDPGPLNAMGRVKFMLPNRFNVYLHDTPHRELFDRSIRAFSSGCIRIEKPAEFAAYLLRDVPGWDLERVKTEMGGAKRKIVRLPEPRPVYLVYWTAWVAADGAVHFRPDVYARDRRLAAAAEGKRGRETSD